MYTQRAHKLRLCGERGPCGARGSTPRHERATRNAAAARRRRRAPPCCLARRGLALLLWPSWFRASVRGPLARSGSSLGRSRVRHSPSPYTLQHRPQKSFGQLPPSPQRAAVAPQAAAPGAPLAMTSLERLHPRPQQWKPPQRRPRWRRRPQSVSGVAGRHCGHTGHGVGASHSGCFRMSDRRGEARDTLSNMS